MSVSIGVDEGRGPILGPMVLAAVAVDEAGAVELASAGVADSKAFGSGARGNSDADRWLPRSSDAPSGSTPGWPTRARSTPGWSEESSTTSSERWPRSCCDAVGRGGRSNYL